MSSEVRISVVVATYNGARFVEAQLDSLLAALDVNDEIVVSDDGSKDETRAIVASIEDSRIRLLPAGPRLGYQGNFARAIASARGRFVFFADQDDICLPIRISASLAALRNHQCIFGDATLINENLEVMSISHHKLRQTKALTTAHLFAYPTAIGATMACRREFLELALPFPKKVPHDHWMSVLAAARGELGFVHQPLILYRRHGSAVSSTGARSTRALPTILAERARLAWAVAHSIVKSRGFLVRRAEKPS